MTCKVSLTTHCNGRCRTCPVWTRKGQHMSLDVWRIVWGKLNTSRKVSKIILNGTGDVGVHPERSAIFDVMREGKRKHLVLQTNAAHLPDLPPGLDELVISFNGGTQEAYQGTTGIDFNLVVANVRALYPEIAKVPHREMHMLVWEGNAGTEKDFERLWADFPGQLRLSYKYDNQHGPDRTVAEFRQAERIPCDYLDQLSVWPDGSVVMCAHDFAGQNRWGSLLESTPEELIKHKERMAKKIEHMCGEYTGICIDCNYNVPIRDQIRYVR